MSPTRSLRLRLLFPLAASVVACSLFLGRTVNAQLTSGLDFNADATIDTDGDSRWEDTIGLSGFDFELDTGNGVVRNTGVSSIPGITAAYDFPGGLTGNAGGAELSVAGGGGLRSFQNAPGDWSNNEDVSIEIWFKPDNLTPTPANGQILFEDGGGTGFGFFVDDNELRLRKAGGGNLLVGSDISAISGEFIQAVGTFDASAGSIELFINGASVGTDSGANNDWTGGDNAAVGTRGQANTGGLGAGQQNTESFDGQVAVFRLWRNQILSAGEVSANFAAVNATDLFFDNGGTGSDWGTAENWDTNLEPTSAQNAFVGAPGGVTATLTLADETALSLVVGHNNGAAPAGLTGDGTVTMLGGSMGIDNLRLGQNGQSGTFNLIDGTLTITNTSGGQAVQIGDSGGGVGEMTIGDGISSPTLTSSGGRFEVGTANDATATLNMNSGTVNIGNNNLILGQGNANDVVTINFAGGTFTNTGGADYNINDGDATHNHTGGILTIGDDLQGNNGGADGDFFNLNISGGEVNIGDRYNGRNGNDTFTISGTGKLTFGGNFDTTNTAAREFVLNLSDSGELDIGNNLSARGGNATLNFDGGTATIGNNLNLSNTVNGDATVNVAGGDVIVQGDINFRNNGTDAVNVSAGTLDLTGGDVNGATGTNSFTISGTGTLQDVNSIGVNLDQSGGTLKVGASMTDVIDTMFMQGPGPVAYNMTGGVLEIEINSLSDPGDQSPDDGVGSDFVNVTGDAFLDGIIKLASIDGFVPQGFTSFDVLTADDITLGPNFGIDPSMFDARLTATAEIIPGGNGEILRLTVTPEPASILAWCLVGLVGFLAVARMRRKV